MLHIRKGLAVAGVALAMTTSVLSVASPASAASRDGTCASGEFCYYYGDDEAGSVSDFTESLDDYGDSQPSCYEFKGDGEGKGSCVKNKAASVWNRTSKTVRVYYNSNYGGASQDFVAGAKGNLNDKLRKNNASHEIAPPAGGAQTPRDDYDGNARGFAQNNCTAFAAYRIATRLGVPSFNHTWKAAWGNAGNWDNAAREAGVRVDTTPKVGAIAVNDTHNVGHVAYVNKVYPDGSFDVEEYNWNSRLAYGTRTGRRVSSSESQFQHMLHF